MLKYGYFKARVPTTAWVYGFLKGKEPPFSGEIDFVPGGRQNGKVKVRFDQNKHQ